MRTEKQTKMPRVLVVDDEPQILLAVSDLLDDDYEVVTCARPEQALETISCDPLFDVVVSDQRMPGLSGNELLARVARDSSASRILMTGFADIDAVISSINDGKIFAYVAKPWDPGDLMLKVKQAAHQCELQRELGRERKLFVDLMGSIPDGIFIKDTDLRFVRVNAAMSTMLSLPESRVAIDRTLAELAGGRDEAIEIESLERQVIESGQPSVNLVTARAHGGDHRWTSETRAPIRNGDGEIVGLVGVVRDVTERKLHEAQIAEQRSQLEYLDSHDPLTGLANRRLFEERLGARLDEARATGGRLAVCLIDVDRLRHVVETFGRASGDDLVAQVAARLETAVPGRTLARHDGDTFAVLIGAASSESRVAAFIEERVLAAFADPFAVACTELRISARCGVAMSPDGGDTAERLIANAAAALARTAAGRKPYRFYSAHMNAQTAERLSLETRLRHAIEDRELTVVYQPKLDVRTGKVAGFEALSRWTDSKRGFVSPGEFIPLLEETGLIVDLGHSVIETAAAQYCAWIDEGLDPGRIAVNVSPVHLAQPDFSDTLGAILDRDPRSWDGIELEITEGVFVHDYSNSIRKLGEARERGARIAIDDFGTGYSSLGYLRQLPVDILKVDRAFVNEMTTDAKGLSLVMAMISLAHSLDLEVVAEGVETAEQAHLLQLLRCDQLQGYLIARPFSSDCSTEFLIAANNHARAA